MIDFCMAKQAIDTMPWPAGTRPLLGMGRDGEKFVVHLYSPKAAVGITTKGPIPECALRVALVLWIGPKPGLALSGDVLKALNAQIARLTN